MLRSISLFFKKEPLYLGLLLAVLAFYGYLLFYAPSRAAEPKASGEMAHFREAEKKWNQDMSREGAFRDFAAREPVMASLFEAMTLFFILAILAGLFVDTLLIFKPASLLKCPGGADPPVIKAWPFSILFKVILLFIFYGIVLSLIMGTFQALFPKRVSENGAMIFHTLALNGLGLYFVVRFIKSSGGTWRDLGFHRPTGGILREIRAGFLGYLGALPVFSGVVLLLLAAASFIHYEPPAHPLVNALLEDETRAPFLVGISVFLGIIAGPLLEEIFFRGFCYPIFRDRWGKGWGIVLSAAFFAGIHHSGFVFWPVFILGVALAYLYEQRRSLVASITLHITHNTLLMGYFFLIKQILGR